MKYFEDDKLHLYVLNSSALLNIEKQEIEFLLNADENFRMRVEKIKLYYGELNKINTEEIKVDYKRVLNQNIISLKSFDLFNGNGVSHSKLAASTEAVMVDEFKYIHTFASAEHLILARVNYNNVLNEYIVYLIADDMKEVQNAVICICGKNYYVSDKDGIIKIRDTIITEDIALTVHRPLLNADLNNLQNWEMIVERNGLTLKVNRLNNHFNIELTPKNPSIAYIGFIFENSENAKVLQFNQENKTEAVIPSFENNRIVIIEKN